MAQMRQGLTAWRATGAKLGGSYILALLVKAYGQFGQADEGLLVLDEAITIAHHYGERFYKAEICRLTGELLLRQAAGAGGMPILTAEAEAKLRQALDVARQQQAKGLELQAVIIMSRLWRYQGKRDQARQLLAESYGRFTEGFDTADLREVKQLLKALS
jgi:predicted ATPase